MKKVFQQIVSIAMVLLLLASTTFWKVEKHYCMGRLVNVSLFANAATCGMDTQLAAKTNIQKKNSCCSDEVVVIEGQDNLQFSFDEISSEQQFFIAAYAYSYVGLLNIFHELCIPNKQYPPPLLVKDIQVLDQVFLI